jgi:type IX secretion system PorP/SprF family membrane protein
MKKAFLKRSLVLLASCLLFEGAKAQVDPHFSQYYVYPSWLNPALTGAFDGSYRVSGIYRSQWGNVSSPFKTSGFSAEFTTEKNINVGASVIRQTAGSGGYSYTTAYGNVAYTGVRLGAMETHRITFGMQAGFIERRFDLSKMTFGDQWNPGSGFNPSNPSADMPARNASAAFDVGAGALYFDATPGKKANAFGGVSVSHLTRPEDKFRDASDARLPMRFTAHGGVRIHVNEDFSITPNALFLRQGTAEEKMIGAYGQLKITSTTDLMLGANYRFKDAFSPYVGFTYNNMVLGASYDVNTSDLSKMANGSNSFEISLSFFRKKSVKTPEVEFVCPVL